MKNIFMSNFKLANLETHSEDNFTPLKIILKNKPLFDALTINDVETGSGFLEQTLSITQVFSSGLNGWLNEEFGFTFAGFDYISMTLEFMMSGIHKDKIKLLSFFKETKICFQNFLASLVNRSYYSALFEMRRLAESCLWLAHLKAGGDIKFSNLQDLGMISSQFDKYNPKLKNFWAMASDVIHGKKLIKFNWENKDDDLKFVLQEFQKCSAIIITTYKSFFKSDIINQNEVMKNYNNLWDIMFYIYERPTYNLKDKAISSTIIPSDQAKLYAKYNELRISPKRFTISMEVDTYKTKLKYKLNNNGYDYGGRIRVGHPLEPTILIDKKYATTLDILEANSILLTKKDREKIIKIVSTNSIARIFDFKVSEIKKSNLYTKLYKNSIHTISDTAGQLLGLELSGKDKKEKLLLTRLIVEDILFNMVIGNVVDGPILNYLCLVAGVKPEFNFAQYRHISITDRIIKATNYEEAQKEFKDNEKFIDVIICCLNKIVSKFK